jgi:hypothetical protein
MEIYSLEYKINIRNFVKNLKTNKMKTNKIIYYVSTGLLTVLLLFSAGMYFFNHEEVAGMFTNFGYPTYIIYPYAVAKILGLIALWFLDGKKIKEWAYAGFFFAFIFALFAHFMIGDGKQMGAIMAMILLIVSYIYNNKVNQ